MIDVDDLAEVVRPVRPAVRAIRARLPGWRLAARQHGCDRRKEVAPVKAGRETLRLPVDVPTARLSSAALDQLEQAVAGADVPPAVGLDDNARACPADAGIDDAEKHGSRWKPFGIDRQEVGRCLGIADRRIGEEVDRRYARRHLMQHRLHLADVRTLQPEIREQHDHGVSLPSAPADLWRALTASTGSGFPSAI